MDPSEGAKKILQKLEPHLTADTPGGGRAPRLFAVMTCGIAGAGKSTLSKALVAEHPSFTRLSSDAILAERHGICGADFAPELYAEYLTEASEVFSSSLDELLREGRNVVLDRSFYARQDRDEFKARIEAAGGKWILVYLKAERDVLWRRIRQRRENGINADSALDIKEDLLDAYVGGFEAPEGEGEIVIEVL